MIQIKIYDREYNALTAFNEGEHGALTYRKTLGQIGDASFTLDINNAKVTEANMRSYNRIEIRNDGVVEWAGYILNKQITLNQVTIRCKEIIGVLAKRLCPNNYTMSGNAATVLGTLLALINADEDTGITMGESDVTASINMTFNQQDVFSIIQSIADTVQAKFLVNENRELIFKTNLGDDLSSGDDIVELRYDINQPQLANLTNFNVTDDGEQIVSRSYGKTDTLSSLQESTPLKNKYGKLDKFNSFTQSNTQGNLDAQAAAKLSDSIYTPALDLTPGTEDNFKVGDTVKVSIENKLVTIDDAFQILEKSVKIVNKQKQITVKINQLPRDAADEIKELQRKVNLLETS